MQKISKHWIFFVLLVLGLILRLIFISEQGLSNDELSAWYRTKFTTWDSFWNDGVKTGDMHPAFYQVFLWIWVKVFGDTEFSIRATSLLFYILNSILIYKISCKHFTKLGGLLLQGLYTGLTFMVINTVFARPYNSGTFFLLLSFWAVLELKNSDNKWKWTLLLSVGLLGAMLSHYFAFFVAIVIGISSLLYVGQKKIPKILIAGCIAVLAFIPHIGITLFQLQRGGLGWLAPPDLKWSIDFIYLFFNESWILTLIMLSLLISSIYFFGIHKISKASSLSLLIFLMAFFGAYLISYSFTPILRETVMVFILPFLLLPILSLVKEKSQKWSLFLIAFVTILPLADSLLRHKLLAPVHFGVFRENGTEINKAIETYGKENITFASNYNNINYINYYVNQDLKEAIIDWDQADALYKLAEKAKKAKTKYFCYSFSNKYHVPMFLEVIRKYYPHEVSSMNTKFTCFYLYSKSPGREKKTFFTQNNLDTSYVEKEFLAEIKIPYHEFPSVKNKFEYYLFSCSGIIKDTFPFYLVVTVERDGKTLMAGENPKVYYGYDQTKINQVGVKQVFFTAFDLPEDLRPTDIVKAYCWNPNKGKVRITNIKMSYIANK